MTRTAASQTILAFLFPAQTCLWFTAVIVMVVALSDWVAVPVAISVMGLLMAAECYRQSRMPALAHCADLGPTRVLVVTDLLGILGAWAAIPIGWELSGPRASLGQSFPWMLGFAIALIAVVVLSWRAGQPSEPSDTVPRKFFLMSLQHVANWDARRNMFASIVFVALIAGTLVLTMPMDLVHFSDPPESIGSITFGVVCGVIFSVLQGNPQRSLSSVPFGLALALIALVVLTLSPRSDLGLMLFGFAAGWPHGPVRAGFVNALPPAQRLLGMFTMVALQGLAATIIAVPMALFRSLEVTDLGFGILALVALIALVILGRVFMRELIEQIVEMGMWPVYQVHMTGPGARQIPLRGPAIIFANHAAWLDPLWMAKAAPCRVTPLMTARFFDIPVVSWIVGSVAHTIRVPEHPLKREAPEIQEAIRRLDRGEIILIFPEGYLRRKEQQLLKRFGQGIYQMLREKPETPIIACWIEGGWGSYTSYFNGPPTKNKRKRIWRRIRIGVSTTETISADILADQSLARKYLMQACLNARAHLGLPVPIEESFVINGGNDKEDEPDDV
jgi:1-acyl-sn-glycerol-3-phosphate acyltransferase